MEVTEKPPPAETPVKLQKHPSSAPPHLLLSFANGALKRHHHHQQQNQHRQPTKILYRECLKNHAANLGRHALDGCGEFMPSPNSIPSDPTSLKCAACGCHRNFHRRSDDTDDEGDIDDAQFTPKRRRSSSPPAPLAAAYSPSAAAPHMLLALSAGHSGAVPVENSITTATNPVMPNANSIMVRKRFRTKFSREQKEKMYAFAEKLGWKMQKQDDGIVEEFCREVGVGKGVLKVWMHNHKHASSVKRNISSTCNNTEANNNTNNTNVVLNASSSSS